MAITVTIDNGTIAEMFKDILDNEAKIFFYNMFYKDMQPYVPADTLTMYDTADISADGILFVQPYSSAPYYGRTKNGKQMNFKKDVHPLATDHWEQAAWAANKDKLLEELEKFINRRQK